MTSVTLDERGSATELALAAPLMILMLLLPVYVSRLSEARAEVDAAARDAARAASIERGAGEASDAARRAAAATLDEAGVSCGRFSVATDTTAFRPDGWVAVDVSCTVALGDLVLLRVPASTTLSSSFVAPVDRLRGAG